MRDYIDDEYERRIRGHNRALSQSDHAILNARYPGASIQRCAACDEPTGKGEGEPICDECRRARDGDE